MYTKVNSHTGTSEDKTRMIMKCINVSNIERGKFVYVELDLDLSIMLILMINNYNTVLL